MKRLVLALYASMGRVLNLKKLWALVRAYKNDPLFRGDLLLWKAVYASCEKDFVRNGIKPISWRKAADIVAWFDVYLWDRDSFVGVYILKKVLLLENKWAKKS